jgi:hypothetical protein
MREEVYVHHGCEANGGSLVLVEAAGRPAALRPAHRRALPGFVLLNQPQRAGSASASAAVLLHGALQGARADVPHPARSLRRTRASLRAPGALAPDRRRLPRSTR